MINHINKSKEAGKEKCDEQSTIEGIYVGDLVFLLNYQKKKHQSTIANGRQDSVF